MIVWCQEYKYIVPLTRAFRVRDSLSHERTVPFREILRVPLRNSAKTPTVAGWQLIATIASLCILPSSGGW
jgi:hypothetical protein